MRLYLSSFRIGDHAERLLDLAGSGRRLAVIGNALDAESSETRRGGVDRELAELGGLGFDAAEVDLRAPGAVQALRDVDVIWVRGGNVFVLRRALADSGADETLVDLIERDDVVYAGYSAGAVVLAPDLHGCEWIDDSSAVREPIWQGLGVLDRAVVPHVDSPGHPESADCELVRDEFARRGKPHWALRDGDVLLVQTGHGRARVWPRSGS